MKKLVTTGSALLAGVTIVAALSPVVASAAVNDATPAAIYNSNGEVTFVAGDTPTSPVDPGNPGTPVDPENPDGTNPPIGTAGPLSIDFASSLTFGTQKISSSDQTYYAAPQKIKNSDGTYSTVADYVQVTDNRGSFAGWSLYVNWDGQFRRTGKSANSSTLGDVLTGAQLTFNNGSANNATVGAISPSAATSTYTLGDTTGTAQQLVMNATAGQGMGTNVAAYGTSSSYDGTYDATGAYKSDATQAPITLKVPGSTAKVADTYTTNLTWTLSSTPDLS